MDAFDGSFTATGARRIRLVYYFERIERFVSFFVFGLFTVSPVASGTRRVTQPSPDEMNGSREVYRSVNWSDISLPI